MTLQNLPKTSKNLQKSTKIVKNCTDMAAAQGEMTLARWRNSRKLLGYIRHRARCESHAGKEGLGLGLGLGPGSWAWALGLGLGPGPWAWALGLGPWALGNLF